MGGVYLHLFRVNLLHIMLFFMLPNIFFKENHNRYVNRALQFLAIWVVRAVRENYHGIDENMDLSRNLNFRNC